MCTTVHTREQEGDLYTTVHTREQEAVTNSETGERGRHTHLQTVRGRHIYHPGYTSGCVQGV